MEVKFDSRTDCVFATFTGPISAEGLLQAFYKAFDAAVERGLDLILLDCSASDGTLTAVERFKIGESGAAYSFSKSRKLRPKVAVVGNAPLIDGLAAVTASNRGLNAKTFSDVQQALDWLGIADPNSL
jgi:hypothetical protein